MKELYFHIGLHKTGTSALQKFFDINRDALRKEGIYYPKGDVEQRKDNVLMYNGNAMVLEGIGLLSKDADAFGTEELSCIDKLKSMFNSDDISDFELPKFQVNPSLSRNMVEIRRIFNSISGANNLFPILWGIRGRESAYTKSEEKIVKHPSFLTYEQRKYILDYYNESNISLGREYFGVDGPPFALLEKIEEDDEEAENDNSMYADLVAFLGEILVKQQEIFEMQYDYILISVDTKKTEDSIQQYLEENGVERERIIRAIG